VRAIIAAAGLGGLAATAAFALPVLRATAGQQVAAREPGRAADPDQVRAPDQVREPGRASAPDQVRASDQAGALDWAGAPDWQSVGLSGADDGTDGTGQISADRHAGAAGAGRPLR
jgi:hypothetical protein